MNRRDFFKRLGAATAITTAAALVGMELDPDKLLWRPGERTFFLPPEKRLVAGDEAIREFDAVVKAAEREGIPLGQRILRRVSTPAGSVEADHLWNVLSLNGRAVSAEEEARLNLTYFARYGATPSADELAEATARVITQRTLAGWPDPVFGRFVPPAYRRK